MTTLTANSTASLNQGLGSLAARKRGILFGFGLGYRAYLAYARLSSMSDAQLEGMGLTRAELPAAAFKSAGMITQ